MQVGKGKLLLCSVDLNTPSETGEEALVKGQFLRSLQDYASSGDFAPRAQLEFNELKNLLQS